MRKSVCIKQLSLALLPMLLCTIFSSTRTEAADAPSKSLLPVRIEEHGTTEARSVIQSRGKLTLDIYLRAVDTNFPGLAGAEDQRRIANSSVLEKKGIFDPLFSTENGYTRMQNTSRIGADKFVLFNYPKFELPFQSGVRAFAQYRYNPNSAQSPYIETGEGGEYSAGILVPLLRGLFVNEQSVALKEAKLGTELATQTYFLTRLDTLVRAGVSYWSWVGSKQKSDVSAQILRLSNTIAGIARQQEQNGDLARIYVTEAEEDIARRDADMSQARRDFQRNSFKLSTLLFDIGGIPLPIPSEENVPEEIPLPAEISTTQTEHHIMLALRGRPELKAIDVQKDIAKVELKLAQNQLLPVANAVYTEGYDTGKNGIGNVYRGQITISEPLLLRTARGKVAGAKLRLDKLAKERQAEEQRIRNEVLDAISAINLAFQKSQALEQQVAKADQVYQGERERFQIGDSTVFLVAERERQLNEAKIRLIDAEVEYHLGVLALRAITVQL
ncbi:MAG TPA: TolC family protein [Oculatellaceae cyanobacterium]